MIRRLVVMLTISGAICLLGAIATLAQLAEQYELKEYESLVGEKLEFNEAPELRVLVAAGELDPVKKRLPEEPVVIEPAEEIGQYGGRIHIVTTDIATDAYSFLTLTGLVPILRFDPEGTTILPNIAKDWTFSDDAKTLTLYLRKGMKWSDGVSFTADDIMFWYEDIMLNDEITTSFPVADWYSGGEVMKMEKIDDYTVRVHFSEPHPLVLQIKAFGASSAWYAPKHYLTQFHALYTPVEKLDAEAQEAGFDYWYQLFENKYSEFLHPGKIPPAGYPVLYPYRTVKKALDYAVAERNPYYWKVDTEGNQLPYIDEVLIIGIADKETRTAKIVSGDIDFEGSVNLGMPDVTLLLADAEKGDYRVLITHGATSSINFMLNQNVEDPVLQDIFQDIRFRIALSVAIKREEINDHVFFGLGVPGQVTVHPSSKYYKEEFARAYAQYDIQEANRLLDEMGLKWDKDHEWRLRPDGQKLGIVYHFTEFEVPIGEISELVKEYWKAIGIDLSLKSVDWGAYTSFVNENRIEMGGLWTWELFPPRFLTGYAGGLIPAREPWMVPSAWSPLWRNWLATEGKEGEEPPEEIKKNWRLWWDVVKVTPDEEERARAVEEILRSQAENLWTIGTVGSDPRPILVKNDLWNVPKKFEAAWDWMATARWYPEQYFFKTK